MLELFQIIMANLPVALLLLAGIILVSIEMFIPGFGIPGISGIVCLILGVVFGAKKPMDALLMILGIIVVLCVILFFAMRSAARGRISRTPLVLKDATSAEAGFNSAPSVEYLVGMDGIAVSSLRPAGTAQFDGKRYDVVTEAEFVKSGEMVRVILVEGRRVVVRPAKELAKSTETFGA